MGTKKLIKWPKQITPSLVQHLIRAERDIEKAILVFESAAAEYSNGFRHDHTTYGFMISRLVSVNKFKPAEELLDRMKEEKCSFTEDVFLCLCRSYGRVHRPLDTLRIFQKMKEFQCEPTDKSYVTVFSILVSENQLKLAQMFHKYMKQVGVPPSVSFLNVFIKALCMKKETVNAALRVFKEMPDHGCIPDSYTYGTLINGLCKLGKISEAKELFREMDAKGCSPTVVTYTTLIHGLCLSNILDEAMELFEEMSRKGIEPNVVTFSSLIDGLCKGGRSLQALELLEKIVGKRFSANTIIYNNLVSGLCKEGKVPDAVQIFDRMKLQGLKPDAVLYGRLVNSLCNSSKFQEAANLLDEMVPGGMSPNHVSWSLHVNNHNMVVRGLCTEKDLNRAFQIYLSTRTKHILVDCETYKSLVGCFSKKGDVYKASQIVNEMLLEGSIPDEFIWNAVVFGFLHRTKVKEAAEVVYVELIGNFLETRV